jgi:hypothetical protein
MRRLIVVLCLVLCLCSVMGCRSVPRKSDFGVGLRPAPRAQVHNHSSPVCTPPLRKEWKDRDRQRLRDALSVAARIGLVVLVEVIRQAEQR